MSPVVLHTPLQASDWLHQHHAANLQSDSRLVQRGDGFLAWPGRRHDARLSLNQALSQGAVACMIESEGANTAMSSELAEAGHKLALYAQLHAASGWIADAFYAHPSRAVLMTAVTGTNGKTSFAWWLAYVLSLLDKPTTVVGTLGMGQIEADASSGQLQLQAVPGHDGLTTPDAMTLQRQLRRWADSGIRHCVMEASSIGLVEHRLAGVQVHTAVFTNLTPDHLDFHGTLEAYGQSKARLFEQVGLQIAVIHIDDPFGEALAKRLHQERPEVQLWTVGSRPDLQLQSVTHVQISQVQALAQGQSFQLQCHGHTHRLKTELMGRFNIDNLALVWAVLMAWGQPKSKVASAIASLWPVPGRMQRLGGQGLPQVVIDYAHTPDAVRKILTQVRMLAQLTSGQVITVLGCGGDRDKTKRPVMARAAQELSDRFWLTSDNPRSEDPHAIAKDMLQGLTVTSEHSLVLELKRDRAIAQAIAQARANDWVVIAGKGHEAYQEIAGVRHAFLDADHALRALHQWRPI